MRKYEQKAKDRIRAGLKRWVPIIERAEKEGFNEADTRSLVEDILAELLGYDKHFEVTSEYQVRGRYVDFAVKIDGELSFFVEVKAVGDTLSEKHLFQVVSYSLNRGLEWAVLTNARVWQCYRVGGGKPGECELVFSVDLLSAEPPAETKRELLFLISKEGMWRGHLARYYERARALSPQILGRLLFEEEFLKVLRRKLRKQTGQRLELAEIADALAHKIVRPGVFEALDVTLPRPKRRQATKKLTKLDLPSTCYAYVPDSAKPSTWKLPFRKADGSVDEGRLRAAVAALSPGGYRGSRVEIPPEALPQVKARLRAAYQEIGREVPPGIREDSSEPTQPSP